MKQPEIILPIVYGAESSYKSIELKDAHTLYICVDSGNMYLGAASIGKDVIFQDTRNVSSNIGDNGGYCITPYGVYNKQNDEWKLFSLWHIDENNNLVIGENIIPIFDVATANEAGVVLSTPDEEGAVSVDASGKMTVNGWRALKDKLHVNRID